MVAAKSTGTVSNPGPPLAFLKGWSSKGLKSVHTYLGYLQRGYAWSFHYNTMMRSWT